MDAAPRRQHPDKHPTPCAASPPSTSRKIYTNITPPWWQRPFGPDILELSSNTSLPTRSNHFGQALD